MTLRNPLKIYGIQDENKKLTLLSIAFPLLFQSILNQFYGTLGTMQLSGYSDIAVSASSIANSVLNIFVMIINMVINGTIILSAVAIGAKQRDKTAGYAGTGAVTVVLLALLISTFGFFFAEDLMILMNLEGEALTFAAAYFRTRVLFFPLTALSSLFNSLIICNGMPKITVYIGFFCSTVSLVLGYIVLYTRIESMINPMYSMALVANFVQIISLTLTIIVYMKNKLAFSLSFTPKYSAKIFKLGIPGGMALFMYMLAQTITTSFVADMGIDVINTKIYITNIISYVPMLGNSLAQATSVFMGRFRGAGSFRSMKILYRQNILLTISVNILLSVIVLILHKPLISIFTDNPNIIAATMLIFILDIFVEIPRAVNNISENSLNPNGDVKITFITSTLSCWLGSVALSYVLCVLLDLQLVGIWIAFIADESIKAMIYLFRWKSNKWQKTKI
ncbi:MAG: hypothetical protein IJB86_04935 [Clostridia bacterium]|nr:hypothetical protein [Clostridia bacterium]